MSENPRYIFAVSHSLILIYGGFGHRPPHVRSWCSFGVFGSSRPICVNMCAQWKITHKWHLLFDFAFMSALPYYDSLISFPKPQLIPEPLLSITRVQFLCVAFDPGSLSGGRPEIPPLGAGISGLSDRAPFRQGREVNWLVPSSSSTPAPCSFSLRP